MEKIDIKDYMAQLKAQGAKDNMTSCFVCPMCGTIQNAADLIEAGAGKTFDEIEGFLAFSCIGRWTGKGSPPAKELKGTVDGCNWTLGGLFPFHEIVVVRDGKEFPRFRAATPEEADKHLTKQEERK